LNGFEWSAKVIESLAWPITTIILVFLLRTPLTKVLLTLSKLKYKGLELDFSKELEAVKEAASKVVKDLHEPTKLVEQPAFIIDAKEVSKISPQSAIMLVWTNLESELASAAHASGMQQQSRAVVSPIKIINTLVGEKVLDQNLANLVMAMKELRNKTVHMHSEVSELSEQDASNYIDNAILVLDGLRRKKT